MYCVVVRVTMRRRHIRISQETVVVHKEPFCVLI